MERRCFNRLMLIVWLICLFLAFGSIGSASVKQLWSADEVTVSKLQRLTEGRFQRCLNAKGELMPRQGAREVSRVFFDSLICGAAPEKIDLLLQRLVELQDRNPQSKTCGNLRWYVENKTPVDLNAVEFTVQRVAIIQLMYRDRLSPKQQEILTDFLSWCKRGIINHQVAISYTNIWLMKTWNLIALGEGLNEPETAAYGYKMLDDWIKYTAQTGINEYLSPSYYPVDLESLGLIYNLSNNAKAIKQAEAGIAYLWNEVALNWYAPAERLGGTHSRNYDRLLHNGDFNRTVTKSGLLGQNSFTADNPYAFYSHTTAPDSAKKRLNSILPRYVSGRCGKLTEQRWHLYMAKNYAIGSSEIAYTGGPDDTPMVINFGEGANVPPINFFMDGRRDYYGQNKVMQKNGHLKALHLRPNVISVQNDNEVLFAAASNAKNADLVSLESNIILPAQAEYFLNDTPLNIDTKVSQWKYNPAPNDKTTAINVKTIGEQTVLRIVDSDKKLGIGVSRNFEVVPGREYQLSIVGNSKNSISLYLNFLGADGNLVDKERILKVVADGPKSFAAIAPPGAVYCKAWVYSVTSATTDVQITDLCFEQIKPQRIIMGDFDFHDNRAAEIEIPVNAVLFVKRGSAVAALRPLGAWNVSQKPVAYKLYNDGLRYGALRLTAVHSKIKTDLYGAAAIWAKVVGDIETSADFDKFRREVLATTVSIKYQGYILEAQVGKMQVRFNATSGERLSRQGMKAVPSEATLWVNGEDLAQQLLLTE